MLKNETCIPEMGTLSVAKQASNVLAMHGSNKLDVHSLHFSLKKQITLTTAFCGKGDFPSSILFEATFGHFKQNNFSL
jgi:hypothetical protein